MPIKILTVDDSKLIRTIVKKALKPYDCELFEAENGVEGLNLTLNHNPDIIILDVTMPVMTGMEMISKLKSDPATKDIPVLMLTAEAGKEIVMEILKKGAAGYMLKPFKAEVFIEKIQGIVSLKEKQETAAGKYFTSDGDLEVLHVPDKVDRAVATEIEESTKEHLKTMCDAGRSLLILNLGTNSEVTVSLIKIILSVMKLCSGMKVHVSVNGSAAISQELKEVEETRHLEICQDLAKAREMLLSA
mgnify:CR=1 FL=1